MSEENKPQGVLKDIGYVIGTFAAFIGAGQLAKWLEATFSNSGFWNLVHVFNLSLKVAVASCLVWLLQKFIFKNTLGKDFGDVFDEGWNALDKKEKTRWILGSFIVLFCAVLTQYA